MLQHSSEATRSRAAAFIIDMNSTTEYDWSLLLLHKREDMLVLLLDLLASNDSIRSRSRYADLLGAMCTEVGQGGIKQIQDAGAIPLVLELLRQAKTAEDRSFCLHCLVVSHPSIICLSCVLHTLLPAVLHPACETLFDERAPVG